jgi:glycosyltransferase involved in cell wall biosynthesis
MNLKAVATIRANISVIIPTYREEPYIKRTLAALTRAKTASEQKKIQSELILVDSGIDKTAEIAKKFTNKIFVSNFRGVSKARNLGASKAEGNVLVFVDADVLVPSKIIDEVQKVFAHKNTVAAVTYVLPQKNGGLSASEKIFFKLDSFFISKIVKKCRTFMTLYTRGDLVAVRKDSFVDVKGFDEDLNCMEITELIRKLLKKGNVEVLGIPVFESCRRIRRYGLWKNYLLWLKNYASDFLRKKPFSNTWEPIR